MGRHALGHPVHRVRHGRGRQGRRSHGDHYVPRRHYDECRANRRCVSQRLEDDLGAARLHGQRDGAPHHLRRPRPFPILSAARRRCAPGRSTLLLHPSCRSATTRCGCCGRHGSSRNLGSPSRPVVAALVEMAPQLERITAERVAAELDKLLLGADVEEICQGVQLRGRMRSIELLDINFEAGSWKLLPISTRNLSDWPAPSIASCKIAQRRCSSSKAMPMCWT